DSQVADLDAQADHWRAALAGLPDGIDLPLSGPRPPVADHTGGEIPFTVPPDVYDRVTALARAEGTTVFMVAQTALAALLTHL
ncbi:hypothetical protein K7G98_42185, partial [Saccharothrix sp. MB29]|nr:hypothetical protein [Saccharothrix sp. MB29]